MSDLTPEQEAIREACDKLDIAIKEITEKPTNNEEYINRACSFCGAPFRPITQGKMCLNGHIALSLFHIWPVVMPDPPTVASPPVFSRWEEPIKDETQK